MLPDFERLSADDGIMTLVGSFYSSLAKKSVIFFAPFLPGGGLFSLSIGVCSSEFWEASLSAYLFSSNYATLP